MNGWLASKTIGGGGGGPAQLAAGLAAAAGLSKPWMPPPPPPIPGQEREETELTPSGGTPVDDAEAKGGVVVSASFNKG